MAPPPPPPFRNREWTRCFNRAGRLTHHSLKVNHSELQEFQNSVCDNCRFKVAYHWEHKHDKTKVTRFKCEFSGTPANRDAASELGTRPPPVAATAAAGMCAHGSAASADPFVPLAPSKADRVRVGCAHKGRSKALRCTASYCVHQAPGAADVTITCEPGGLQHVNLQGQPAHAGPSVRSRITDSTRERVKELRSQGLSDQRIVEGKCLALSPIRPTCLLTLVHSNGT